MELSKQVAYRYYRLREENKAIAFNTRTRNYMFLDGLSADLVNMLLEGQDISDLVEINELTSNDIDCFIKKLSDFGFFVSHKDSSVVENHNLSAGVEAERCASELDSFMNALNNNGFYYFFQLDLTNICNEKCIHCYHPFDKYDYSHEMSTEDIKMLVDNIYDLGVFSVTLSGGECLTRRDFLEILSYIADKGMLTSIYTNGTLINDTLIKHIKDSRVDMVSISLYGDTPDIHDGITQIKGSFERTLTGIQLLKTYDIPFELKCVLLAKNIDRINDIRKLCKSLNDSRQCRIEFLLSGKINGDCSVFAYRASELDIGKAYISFPEYQAIEEKKRTNLGALPCGAGKYSLYCSAEGKIYPCVAFRLYLCDYKELPKINSNSILKRWLETKIADFSDCHKHEYCKHCFRTCAGDNLVENGNYLNSSNVASCRQAKAVYELLKKHSK